MASSVNERASAWRMPNRKTAWLRADATGLGGRGLRLACGTHGRKHPGLQCAMGDVRPSALAEARNGGSACAPDPVADGDPGGGRIRAVRDATTRPSEVKEGSAWRVPVQPFWHVGCLVSARVMSSATTPSTSPIDFAARLEQYRASGRLLFDLTESDPAWCGLGWHVQELEALLAARHASVIGSPPAGFVEAREAVAGYLAGHGASMQPDRVFFVPSRSAVRRIALEAICDEGDEVLVPAPARPLLDPAGALPSVHLRQYGLEFDGEWRLDRRSIRRAIGTRTRAIVVGNPADPTGAMLGGDELALLDDLCGEHGLALVGDELFLDTALRSSASVARSMRCLAVHVSGLTGVCGLPRLGGEWVAVAGPDALAGRTVSRLRSLSGAVPPISGAVMLALPALLARREPYLEALRARLASNRAAIATGSLREAPWTLQWGGGGSWAVLQISPVQDAVALCLALLDEGVAVRPGQLDGLPHVGYLVVSLLPEPEIFLAGLERLEAHLRGHP
jgi:alanine-synthesizing transaminase